MQKFQFPPPLLLRDPDLILFEVDGKTVGEGQDPKKHTAKDIAADLAWAYLTVEAGGSSS
jgi:hypothetical protein